MFQEPSPTECFTCQEAEVWFSKHSPSSPALPNFASSWAGCAKQSELPQCQPLITGRECVVFDSWTLSIFLAWRQGPKDTNFTQVSYCHEKAEAVIQLLLPDEARNMSMVGCPWGHYVDLWTQCGEEQYVLMPQWRCFSLCEVLISSPTLLWLPDFLGNYAQWTQIGVADKERKILLNKCSWFG